MKTIMLNVTRLQRKPKLSMKKLLANHMSPLKQHTTSAVSVGIRKMETEINYQGYEVLKQKGRRGRHILYHVLVAEKALGKPMPKGACEAFMEVEL